MLRNLLSLIILSYPLISCSQRDSGTLQRGVPRVKCEEAIALGSTTREFAGLSTPDDAVNLAFKIGGEIMDIPVSKGQFVSKGEIIAELDPHEIELEVESYRSQYEEASSQLQRMRRLLSHEAISIQEFESAQTRFTQAKSKYQNSIALLQDTKIRAPYDGVIERTYVDTYQRVASGESIARLVKPISTTVSFTMPENLLSTLEQGSPRFSVKFDNYPNRIFKAQLKNFARTSADASGFPTSLRIDGRESEEYNIAPGMSCMISMQSRDTVSGAVTAPLSAIYAPASGGTFVWIVDSTMHVRLSRVKIGGLSDQERAIIDSGLHHSELIVTAGVYKLHNGERVEIINK